LDGDYDERQTTNDEREGKETHRRRHETSDLPCCGKCPWRRRHATTPSS
jgi:hypothetical protein